MVPEYVAAVEYRYDRARGRYRVQRRDPRERVNGVLLRPWSGRVGFWGFCVPRVSLRSTRGWISSPRWGESTG